MEPIPLVANLRQVIGGGNRFPVHVQNMRLLVLGRREFSFYHRERGSFRAIVQFSSETAASCLRYFRRYDRTMTVEEYYFIRYGICLARPHDVLVYFIRVVDTMDEVEAASLFPQELISVVE